MAEQLNELETNADHTERTIDQERITDLQELIMPTTPVHNTRTARENESQIEEINFDVAVRDLSKFRQNLEPYAQEDSKSYDEFKDGFSSVINRMAFQNNQRCSLDNILKQEKKLSSHSKTLLTFVLEDYLKGAAKEVTKGSRKREDIIGTFEILATAWPLANDKERGSSLRDEMINLRLKEGDTIQKHN